MFNYLFRRCKIKLDYYKFKILGLNIHYVPGETLLGALCSETNFAKPSLTMLPRNLRNNLYYMP